MTTKHRFRNKYRLQLREKDHLPMHAHLVGGSVSVAIDLETLEMHGYCPTLLKAEVMKYVTAHRDELIKEWKKWQP